MLLLMGSFNLTNSGFKRNFESVIRLEFRLGNLEPGDRDFILEVRDFLQNTFVDNNDLIEPVANNLKRTVDDLIRSPFFRSVDEATDADIDMSSTKDFEATKTFRLKANESYTSIQRDAILFDDYYFKAVSTNANIRIILEGR